MVDTIAKTMNVPYVAISLRSGERFNIAASRGEAQDKVMKLPLTYQGEMVGQLIVSRRRPGEPFRKVDMRLLETIAHQAGPAVRAVQLTTTLQQSRLRIVTAREEERRRLRRDLHDGLGATLAALHLEAGTLKKAIRNDPDAAEEFVETFRQEIRDSIDSIRHLVYELRPPQLDQLGLIDALRVLANRSSRPADHSRPRLQVDLVSLDPLPPLPAAVEVAAYRIVQEALTNVVQHAGASHCEVRLRIDRDLIVEVVDDGLGLVHTRKGEGGLGILSMRERAVELGGTCEVRLRPEGGTQVLASLPLPES